MIHSHGMMLEAGERRVERRYAFYGGSVGLAIYLALACWALLQPQPESFDAAFHAHLSASDPSMLAEKGQDEASCCERYPFLSMDIELAYDTILYRAPDLRGKNWWCEQIVKGRESVPSMRMKFYRSEWKSEAERSARNLLKEFIGKDASWGEIVKLANKIRAGKVTGRMVEHLKRSKNLQAVDIDMKELEEMEVIDNFPHMEIILRESMKLILAGDANVMLLGDIFTPGSEFWFQAASALDQQFRACYARLPIIEIDSSETEAQNNKLLLVLSMQANPGDLFQNCPVDSGDKESEFVQYKKRMVRHAILLNDDLARSESNYCLCSLRYIHETCRNFVDFIERLIRRGKDIEQRRRGGNEAARVEGAQEEEEEEERDRVRAALSEMRSMDGETLEGAEAQIVEIFVSYLNRKPSTGDILHYLSAYMCWKTKLEDLKRAILHSPEAQSFRVLSRVVEDAQVIFNVSGEGLKEDVLHARRIEGRGKGEEGISRYLFSSIEVLREEDEGDGRGKEENKRNFTDRLSEFAGIFERAYTQKTSRFSYQDVHFRRNTLHLMSNDV
ncbi:hypothetical protein GUITHDRAFT_149331, partial [Guillardia theta CCMP2712]